jgi:hypothetical protein
MLSKPILIAGGVAVAALVLLATSSTSHAAQLPPAPPGPPEPPAPYPGPLPPPPPPPAPGPSPVVTIPEVIVYGDPTAIAFAPETIAAANFAAARVQAGEGSGCSYSPAVHAFQATYNLDPTSQHPENVLRTAAHPHSLTEDGKFGINTATAVFYVTGAQLRSLCG